MMIKFKRCDGWGLFLRASRGVAGAALAALVVLMVVFMIPVSVVDAAEPVESPSGNAASDWKSMGDFVPLDEEMLNSNREREFKSLPPEISETVLSALSLMKPNEKSKAALAMFLKAYKALGQKDGFANLKALMADGLARALMEESRFENAASYFQQAAGFYHEAGDGKRLLGVINENARCHLKSRDVDSALARWREARVLAKLIGDCDNEIIMIEKIGHTMFMKALHRDAIKLYRQSLKLRSEKKTSILTKQSEPKTRYALSGAYEAFAVEMRKEGKGDLALKSIQAALEQSRLIGDEATQERQAGILKLIQADEN